MAMNRVQFQPGLSMHQFMALYGTPEKCEAAVIGWRWPKGMSVPRAGSLTPASLRSVAGPCCTGSAAPATSSAA